MTAEHAESLTEAEAVGVLVCATITSREADRDRARATAARYAEHLAEAERLLAQLAERLADTGWALDADLAEQAQAFLNRTWE